MVHVVGSATSNEPQWLTGSPGLAFPSLGCRFVMHLVGSGLRRNLGLPQKLRDAVQVIQEVSLAERQIIQQSFY